MTVVPSSSGRTVDVYSGEGRWTERATYQLQDNGMVFVESWLEDDDWIGYAGWKGNVHTETIPLSACPQAVQHHFKTSG